jgi:hypothetical protein
MAKNKSVKSGVVRIGYSDAQEIKKIRNMANKEFQKKGLKGKCIVSESEAFEVCKHLWAGRGAVISKRGYQVAFKP